MSEQGGDHAEGTFVVNPHRSLLPISVDLTIMSPHYYRKEVSDSENGLWKEELPIEAFFDHVVVTLASLCRMNA